MLDGLLGGISPLPTIRNPGTGSLWNEPLEYGELKTGNEKNNYVVVIVMDGDDQRNGARRRCGS